VLKAAARQRLAAGQGELDLGLDSAGLMRACRNTSTARPPGVNSFGEGGHLATSSQAHQVRQNAQDQATQLLNVLLKPDHPPWFTALIRQLQSILAGDRDLALVAYAELNYMDVAELLLLLERFSQAKLDTM
jgi:hypothetical protein